MIVHGTTGPDVRNGTNNDDVFNMDQGGNDTVNGRDGNDIFNFGAKLTALDRIDGGDGSNDRLNVDGDYSTKVQFGSNSFVNIETMSFAAGHDYKFAIVNANTSGSFFIDGTLLGAHDNLSFDASVDTDTNFTMLDGAGDDVLKCGTGSDVFVLTSGGADAAFGGDGADIFGMANSFGIGDSINGGDGQDFMEINGDYSAGLHITTTMMSSIEVLRLDTFFNYNFSFANGVAGPEGMFIDASSLGRNSTAFIDAHSEHSAGFHFTGGAADDVFIGGGGSDTVDMTHGGDDTVAGGGGFDTFNAGTKFTIDDNVDGGDGTDVLFLGGDYHNTLSFLPNTVKNIEEINLDPGHSYSFILNNANVAGGQSMSVSGSSLGVNKHLTVDGSHEANGFLRLEGGAGIDTLTGGALADQLIGNDGQDVLTGNGGADQIDGGLDDDLFVYGPLTDSTGPTYDVVSNFDAFGDQFDLGFTVLEIDEPITVGDLSTATFDADLQSAVNSGNLQKNHAVLFTPDGGDLSTHTFLVIEFHGAAGYQAGKDYVIELVAGSNLENLTAGNFI